MRILSLAFMLYILSLAIMPGASAIIVGPDAITTCCADSCGSEEDLPDTPESNENCNPFQSCCPGFAVGLAFCIEHNYIPLFEMYSEQPEKMPADVVLDFWQPPKLAALITSQQSFFHLLIIFK